MDLMTRQKYSSLSISLHWLTVILMVAVYASIELHEAIPRGNALRGAMEDWHIYIGLVILPIAVFRLAFNLTQSTPAITPRLRSWQAGMATAMKVYLYGLMLLMPVLGWVFLSAEGEAVGFFGLQLPAIAPVSDSLAEFGEEAHALLGESGYLFIVLHAAAALYHHYVVRDDTLRRMLPDILVR